MPEQTEATRNPSCASRIYVRRMEGKARVVTRGRSMTSVVTLIPWLHANSYKIQ